MIKVCTLASSSAGNSTYVETSHYKILIDLGRTKKYLSEKILFREHLLYALRKNKSKISQELDYLSELKTQSVFQPNLMRLRFKIIWWLANHRLLSFAELVAKL